MAARIWMDDPIHSRACGLYFYPAVIVSVLAFGFGPAFLALVLSVAFIVFHCSGYVPQLVQDSCDFDQTALFFSLGASLLILGGSYRAAAGRATAKAQESDRRLAEVLEAQAERDRSRQEGQRLGVEKRVLERIAAGAALPEVLVEVEEFLRARLPGVSHAAVIVSDARGTVDRRSPAPDSGSVLSAPIIGSDGTPLGLVEAGFDRESDETGAERHVLEQAAEIAASVIERVRTEEQSRRRLAELAEVSRLVTIGEMTEGLAHELNQPLSAISAYAGAARNWLADAAHAAQVERSLSQINQEAIRAGSIVRRVREFARHRGVLRQLVDVRALVDDVVALCRPVANLQGVRLEVDIAADLPQILVDRVQIAQSLLNIARNGLDAMSQTPPEERVLRIGAHRSGRGIEIEIQDAGAGVAPETLPHLYEPFYSTKPEGMGMGLFISRSIIEAHDGRLGILANAGRGATFQIFLPA